MGHRFNRTARFLAACALAVMLAVPPPALSQEGSIVGVVEGGRTLMPISGALVEIVGTDRGALTDANGRFFFVGLTGTQVTVRITMLGYRTVEQTVRVGDTNLRFTMTEVAIEMDQIVVTGTPGGTQRRSIGNVVTQVRAAETVEPLWCPTSRAS